MRTLLFANNRLGRRVLAHLRATDDLVGVVLHPEARRSVITPDDAGAVPVHVWPIGPGDVDADIECVLSVLFGYRLPTAWLNQPSRRAVNIHPGLLPWNRGADPNVWPLVDGSPAGTTIHVMSAEIDEGQVLAQRSVGVQPDDTAETLYRRLEDASFELFVERWPDVVDAPGRAQTGPGSKHRRADLAHLDLDDNDLATIDKLRARTFPPYGAELVRGGRRLRIRVEIDDLGPSRGT